MKTIKGLFGGVLACVLEIIVGILLLINPVTFTTGIVTVCGVFLLAGGIVSMVRYFRTEAPLAAAGQLLTKGLVMLLAGGFCVMNAGWFLTMLPLVALIYGVVVLVSGLGKVQWTIDLIRAKKGKWIVAAISAVISIACGAVILRNPFATTEVLWTFTGIVLIVQAVVDVVALVFSGAKKKTADQTSASEVEGEAV